MRSEAATTTVSGDTPSAAGYIATGGMAALFAMSFLLIGLPLLLSPFDFWDGRILDHALDTNQIIGVQNWFTTSGWHLQYLVFAGVQKLANATGLPGDTMLRLIAIGGLVGVVFETVRFAENIVRMPRFWALGAGAIVVVFPAWSTLLSSVLFMYVLCSWLVLLGLRMLHDRTLAKSLMGGLILIISLQLNSNFSFSIALAGAYFASAWVYKGRPARADIARFASVIAVSVICYITLKTVFTPSGIYADYNQIDITLSGGTLLQMGIEMLRYMQYPVGIAAVMLAVFASLEMLARLRHRGNMLDGSPAKLAFASAELRTYVWPLLIAVFLIGSAAFPYVIVGKGADLRLLFDWSPRHTFPMALPVGIFAAALARLLCEWPALRRSPFRLAPLVAMLVVLGGMQIAATWDKLARSAYEAGMVGGLQDIDAPPPGLIKIIVPNFAGRSIRYYESNWLLYKAYGREDWHSGVVDTSEEEIAMPTWLDVNQPITAAYASKHIMRGFRNQCVTVLQVSGQPYSAGAVFQWIFGTGLPQTISVETISVECRSDAPASPPSF